MCALVCASFNYIKPNAARIAMKFMLISRVFVRSEPVLADKWL